MARFSRIGFIGLSFATFGFHMPGFSRFFVCLFSLCLAFNKAVFCRVELLRLNFYKSGYCHIGVL